MFINLKMKSQYFLKKIVCKNSWIYPTFKLYYYKPIFKYVCFEYVTYFSVWLWALGAVFGPGAAFALLAPKDRLLSVCQSVIGSDPKQNVAEWSMTEFVFDWKQLVAPSLGAQVPGCFVVGAPPPPLSPLSANPVFTQLLSIFWIFLWPQKWWPHASFIKGIYSVGLCIF